MSLKSELQEVLDDTIFDNMQIMNAQVCGECKLDRVADKERATDAILDLLDKSLVAPSGQAAPRDEGKGGYYDGYHQGIADVRKVIKED